MKRPVAGWFLYPLACVLLWWRSRKPPYHLQRWVNIDTGKHGYFYKYPSGTTLVIYGGCVQAQFGWDSSIRHYLRSQHILPILPGDLE